MRNIKLIKSLTVSICAVVLLILASLTNVVGYQTVESTIVNAPPFMSDSPWINITLNGTMGENGWYVSAVVIAITYDNGSLIPLGYYNINDEGWIVYTTPLIVSTDGYYSVEFRVKDPMGAYWYVGPVFFKIDRTLPHITLVKEKLSANEVKFTAYVSDGMSGIWRVEFFLDDQLISNDTSIPFEWTWEGSGVHIVKAKVYDIAGNSASKSKITLFIQSQSIPNRQQRTQLIHNLIYNLIQHHRVIGSTITILKENNQ